jgi:hypothetical protein
MKNKLIHLEFSIHSILVVHCTPLIAQDLPWRKPRGMSKLQCELYHGQNCHFVDHQVNLCTLICSCLGALAIIMSGCKMKFV